MAWLFRDRPLDKTGSRARLAERLEELRRQDRLRYRIARNRGRKWQRPLPGRSVLQNGGLAYISANWTRVASRRSVTVSSMRFIIA